MACGRPSRFRRVLGFFESQKAKETQGEASVNIGKSWWLEAQSHLNQQQFMQEYQSQWEYASSQWVQPNPEDYPMEVFLNSDGKIIEPLRYGISFRSCRVDQWYDPKCVPGIASQVDTFRWSGRVTSVNTLHFSTFLFANDQYICLNPKGCYVLETGEKLYETVRIHFESRGLKHIVDKINPEIEALFKDGQARKRTRTSNPGAIRRRVENAPISHHWGNPDWSWTEIKVSRKSNKDP